MTVSQKPIDVPAADGEATLPASMPYRTLPASWYVDPEILAIERRTVFAGQPDYVGSVPMVPRHGSWHTVAQREHAEMLVRDGDRVSLVSNICRHRSLMMFHGAGHARTLVCPMHAWSYDLSGRLKNAPLYPQRPDVCLPSQPLQNWNGLLFATGRDVAADLAAFSRDDLDVSQWTFAGRQEEVQPVNWKIPVEVLLENYHAGYIHPGFARFIDPATWDDNEGACDTDRLLGHVMKAHPDFTRNPASPVHERWQRAILELTGGALPPFGLVSGLYYPNVIIEWWPFSFVVSVYTPRTPTTTLMTREYYFDPAALSAMPEYAEIAKAAIVETQLQDDVAHEAFQRGREQRHRGDSGSLSGYGVYQAPTEESVVRFHVMVMEAVAPELAPR